MRIAIAAEGTRGDIHPVLTLSQGLVARGHDVRLCAPPDFREVVEAQGIDYRPVAQDVRAYLESQAQMLHRGPRVVMAEAGRFFKENVRAQFDDLARATEGVDLILAAGTQVAASSIAELRGVPHRFIAYCPSILRSGDFPPPGLPCQTLPRWLNRLAWWGLLRVIELALRGGVNRERERFGLPRVRRLYPLLLGERPVLASDPELAPAPSDLGIELEHVRCLHPFEPEPLPAKLADFLDAGEPPVYVGFGSMTDPEPARSTRLILDAIEHAGVRAVISRGWAGLGDQPLPERVMVTGPTCHASLFQRVAAVVHHGGAGTTTTAARAGAPQVVVPHVLDQYYWGHRVHQLGLAPPPLRRERLESRALGESLRALVGNELVAESARRLGERLRAGLEAQEDPASVLG